MYNIFIQLIGGMALFFWVIAIQNKNKKTIFKLQNIANIFYAIQYFLLGAFSAGFMNIVSVIKGFIFLDNENKNRKNSILQLMIFTIIIVIIGFVTYSNLYSLIPIVITFAYTFSTWQKNTRIIRIVFLVAAICWILYNLIMKAYAPLIGNVIEIISGVISIIKFDILESKNKKK